MIRFKVENNPIHMSVENKPIRMSVERAVPVNSSGNPYTGSYEVIPSEEEQTLNTKNKILKENVKVAPIPNNYGLVTYHQDRTITIS